jgi:hypothetical protein
LYLSVTAAQHRLQADPAKDAGQAVALPLSHRRVLPEMCDIREGVSPVPPLPPWTVRPRQAAPYAALRGPTGYALRAPTGYALRACFAKLSRWAVKTSPQSRLTLEEGDPNVGSNN